jgi:4-hydroxybenzoate polyprenyltransferase
VTRTGSLLRASHPEPTAAVTALATALALSTGVGARSLLVTATFLTGQLSVGWSNDWFDAARDVRTGRTDKPVARGDLPVGMVRAAALTAAALCVPASLALGLVPGLLHLTAVAAAWSYNARLKSTLASWVPYAFSFGAVPSIVTLTLPGGPPAPAWATLAGALLGVGAHLCNVLPDLDEDLATGVRGLPHALGARRSGAVAAVLLLGAALLLAMGPGRPGPLSVVALGAATAVTAWGLVRARRPGSRDAFRAAMLVSVLSVALLLARGAALVPG